MSTELLKRFFTALPLIGGSIIAIFYVGAQTFLMLDTLLILLAAWEWSYLCGYTDKKVRYGYLGIVSLGCYTSQYIDIGLMASVSLLLSMGLITYISLLIRRLSLILHTSVGLAVIGGGYLCMTWYMLAYLKAWPSLLGIGLLLVILTDSCAYFVGRTLGQHALAPFISPNKTWEGFLGGVLGPTVIVMLMLILRGAMADIKGVYIVLSLMTSLVAQAGDLVESAIKRQRKVKDSGNWLPGHGGLLDRLDSIVSAIPFFAASVYFMTMTA